MDEEDCTICLFIPYHKFMTIPACELRKIKEFATIEKLKPEIFKFYIMAKITRKIDCDLTEWPLNHNQTLLEILLNIESQWNWAEYSFLLKTAGIKN